MSVIKIMSKHNSCSINVYLIVKEEEYLPVHLLIQYGIDPE